MAAAPPAMPPGGGAPPVERGPCRAVIADIDGTLFPFGTRRPLSEANRAALLRALEAGVPVCVATGRIPGPWSEALRRELPGLGPCVFGNGSLLLNPSGNCLYEAVLPDEAVRTVESFFRGGVARATGGRVALLAATRWPDDAAGTEVYAELAPYGRTWATQLIDNAGEPPNVLLEDFAGLAGRRIHKFVVFTDARQEGWSEMPPIVEALRRELGDCAALLDCGPRQCEIFPPGTNKGAGVRELLRALGVAPCDALALGDADNDVEMLRLAGVGAAMGNGTAGARAAADVVVGPNFRDGVAEAVRRFVFGEAE